MRLKYSLLVGFLFIFAIFSFAQAKINCFHLRPVGDEELGNIKALNMGMLNKEPAVDNLEFVTRGKKSDSWYLYLIVANGKSIRQKAHLRFEVKCEAGGGAVTCVFGNRWLASKRVLVCWIDVSEFIKNSEGDWFSVKAKVTDLKTEISSELTLPQMNIK